MSPVQSSGTPRERYAKGAQDTLPYGATRASDLIPHELYAECETISLGSFTYCPSCNHPAYRGSPVLRTAEVPVQIMNSKIEERIAELLKALLGKAGQQQK